jgi:hypothetical protein
MEKKHVELYQLVIAVILVLGSIAKTYVDMSSRISILESQRIADEKETSRMNITLEKLLDGQQEILIKLEGKKNRDNNKP